MSEPGGVVVQTEGGDPEPVDVKRRGRDVVLGESISAETGVNQRPAPPKRGFSPHRGIERALASYFRMV